MENPFFFLKLRSWWGSCYHLDRIPEIVQQTSPWAFLCGSLLLSKHSRGSGKELQMPDWTQDRCKKTGTTQHRAASLEKRNRRRICFGSRIQKKGLDPKCPLFLFSGDADCPAEELQPSCAETTEEEGGVCFGERKMRSRGGVGAVNGSCLYFSCWNGNHFKPSLFLSPSPYPNSPASVTSLNISTTVISSVSNPLSKCRDVFQTDYWNADLLYIL